MGPNQEGWGCRRTTRPPRTKLLPLLQVTCPCDAVTEMALTLPRFPTSCHPESHGVFPCWLPAPPPAQTYRHMASLLADELGAPVGLGACATPHPSRRPAPSTPTSGRAFCPSGALCVGWRWPVGGQAPHEGLGQWEPLPKRPAGPPPAMSFNKHPEGFFFNGTVS